MRWRNFIEHYYRYRQAYCCYRQGVLRHYTKVKFSSRLNLHTCSPKQVGKGFRVYFLSPFSANRPADDAIYTSRGKSF